LAVELGIRRLAFERQVPIAVMYKGHRVGDSRLDLLVGGHLVVELKAVDTLAPVHLAQVRSYLKACDLTLGLILNFNVTLLPQGIKRVIRH
jgi:GxxExxY protein